MLAARVALALLSLLAIAAGQSQIDPPGNNLAEVESADPRPGKSEDKETIPETQHNEAETEAKGTKATPTISPSVFAEPETVGGKHPSGNKNDDSVWGWPDTIKVVAGLVTITSAVIGSIAFLWRKLRRSGTVVETLSEANTIAANDRQEALRLAQRPWVAPTGESTLFPASGHPAVLDRELRIAFKNTGRSPALRAKILGKWSLSKWDDPAPDKAEFTQEEVAGTLTTMISPDAIQWQLFILPPSAINPATDRAARLWIYGVIEYWDAFGRELPYVTKFCFTFSPGERRLEQIGPYNDCT
jgi:hypothetical protein